MAGPRILGPRILRQQFRPTQVRGLHMTGAATAPARLATLDAPIQAQFQDPTPAAPKGKWESPSRYFNTSREMKQVNDSSTIDFAYLPTYDLPVLAHEDVAESMRVPILPHVQSNQADSPHAPPDAAVPHFEPMHGEGPTIATVSCQSTHIHVPSSMADVHDGASHHTTDYHEVADTIAGVRDAARKVTLGLEREVDEQAKQAKGVLKTVWTGLVSDVFGSEKVAKA